MADYLDGEWVVGIRETDGNVRQIGTLTISGYTYSYQPIPQSEVPNWMGERFPFINELTGNVRYESENQPGGYFESIEDRTTLTKLSFGEQGETFLISIDKTKKQLYFHAQISELQLYEITKSDAD